MFVLDKICDQVSDAVLDACLAVDPLSKVACGTNLLLKLWHVMISETAAKTGMIMILGEITTTANPDYQAVVRDAIKEIGFDDSAKGIVLLVISVTL